MRSFIAVLLVMSCTAYSQIPRTISYQGVLADAQGNLVPDGNHQLSLKLFDAATNGNRLFEETQTVPVVKGLFNAIIGSVTPLPASLSFDRAYFLGVSIDGVSELSPRTPLTAVPYALRAERADLADALSPNASGAVTSINNQSGALTIQGAGGTTVTNSGNTFTVSSTGAGGTGIQGVQSTDGTLAIANPNGPVANLSIPANAVTSSKIADATIATADIADNAVTVAKIGEAGATSGQVITYSGSDVVWQTPAGVSGTGVANRLAFWSGANTLTSDANYTVTPGNNTRIALGFQCTAGGDNGVALGSQCSASGSNTVAIGAGSIASVNGAVAVGVSATASGVRAHAIGNFVTAGNSGAFVLGDANTTALASTLNNQMNMRFVGGYRLFSNSAFTTGVTMAAGVSGWTNICDRNLKENFSPVDGEWILGRIHALPISEWSYKNSDPGIRYIGPMAQDFHEAFHLGGTDSLGINSIIADGVNLAAIKALEERTRLLQETVRAQQSTIEELTREVRAHRVHRTKARKES